MCLCEEEKKKKKKKKERVVCEKVCTTDLDEDEEQQHNKQETKRSTHTLDNLKQIEQKSHVTNKSSVASAVYPV